MYHLHGFQASLCIWLSALVPDLSRFAAINPCGLEATVMASMSSLLGRPISLADVKPIVERKFAAIFGREFDRDAA